MDLQEIPLVRKSRVSDRFARPADALFFFDFRLQEPNSVPDSLGSLLRFLFAVSVQNLQGFVVEANVERIPFRVLALWSPDCRAHFIIPFP